MATSLAFLGAGAAQFPTSNAAALLSVNARDVLAFDAAAAETAYWDVPMPQGITGTLQAIISYFMASATSGKVDFEVSIEAITPGDATDLDAGTSFDTANAVTAPTVPATAGYESTITCTLTNADSYAAGDMVRLRLVRDATDGTNDTAAGDAYVRGVELQKA